LSAHNPNPWPDPHPFRAERRWLDCLLEREILRLRARYELSLDELRGLYISDAQVDALLADREAQGRSDPGEPAVLRLTAEAAQWRARFDPRSPLALAGERLGLSGADLELIFIASAPELDLRYEPLYGYLNNDIARRTATLDMAQRLLDGGAPNLSRNLSPDPAKPQGPEGPDGEDWPPFDGHRLRTRADSLIAAGLLFAPDDGERRSSLVQPLLAPRPLARFLLGIAPRALERSPDPLHESGAPPGGGPCLERIQASAQAPTHPAKGPGQRGQRGELILCRGEDGLRLAQWARDLLAARGLHGLHLSPEVLATDPDATLLARLAGAALVLHESPSGERDPAALERLAATLERIAAEGGTVLWLVPRAWQPAGALSHLPLIGLELPRAGLLQRTGDWTQALCAAGLYPDPSQAGSLAASLAGRFSFDRARIRQAAASARVLAAADPAVGEASQAVERAARQIAAQTLAQVAQHATKPHTWEQLVLPSTTLSLLREVGGAIGSRERVYRDWAMQRRTGRSCGLMLLFAGASGTGKTMAASVIANQAGLELFRIDLAGVVSKYIGETEKNLDRIFAVARDADAILLFDEADALLGKRAEVKDAHDRYANIEVAYLLQKMEEHDGVVVLATNLPKNLDQAFARRMHYVVEFPRPNPLLRLALWRGMLPPELPRGDDIDFGFLAEQFDLTGGDIQTVVLEAAFLAAGEGAALSMGHLMHALARRQTKHGDPGAQARLRVHRDALVNKRP
jgi:hypothetical protein